MKNKIKIDHPTYHAAEQKCGECLGVLSEDDIYSKLTLEQLEQVKMWGFVGLIYQQYHNAWTPGMSRQEANRRSGNFTSIYDFGACAPTAVTPDDEPETLEPCSGDKDYGFYWVTPGSKTLDHYIQAAREAAEDSQPVE